MITIAARGDSRPLRRRHVEKLCRKANGSPVDFYVPQLRHRCYSVVPLALLRAKSGHAKQCGQRQTLFSRQRSHLQITVMLPLSRSCETRLKTRQMVGI